MKDTLFEWLQQSPWLVALAALMLATHILAPTEGIGALYGDIIAIHRKPHTVLRRLAVQLRTVFGDAPCLKLSVDGYITGLIAIPVALERWLTRHYRRERLSDLAVLALLALLAGAVIVLIAPASLDLIRGSKTVTTQNYHTRETAWSTHRKTRYLLELPETRARLHIDYPHYSQLTNTNTHTIRVEYWPASGIIRRLTINPTEESQ